MVGLQLETAEKKLHYVIVDVLTSALALMINYTERNWYSIRSIFW